MSIKKGYWNSNALANPAMRSRDDSYSIVKLGNGESWDIDSAMTNIENSGSNKIHICTLNKDTYTDAAIDTLLENFGATLELTIDSSTFVITAILKNKDGTTLGTPQTIDLPLESVVVSGSYDNATKSLILTLENGNTITIPIADLISGLQEEITVDNKLDADLVDDSTSTNKFVTSAEKTNWNNHIANTGNPHSVTKAQVGLGNVDNTSDLNKPISTATQTALNGKQATISDLATIRSNAQAGKAASDTIATYGNIVTHNVAEFATAAQGVKADTAVQPADLATVATTGSYNDLTDTPVIPSMSNRVNGAPLSNLASVFYGTSSTAAATVEKEVSIPSITTLDVGTVIVVQPTVTSTVANSTIKLNNFSAYPMRYNNTAITTSTDSIVWNAAYPSVWVFDGTYWRFVAHGIDTDTTYGSMSVSEGTTGTATSNRVVRANYLKQIIQGTTLTGIDVVTTGTVSATDTITEGIGKLQATKADTSVLATVATTGDYDDLLNKPTIPTVNDATLTIQKNGTSVATFTANASSNVTANISVPTTTNDLTNNSGFITSSDIPVTDVTVGGTSVVSSGVAAVPAIPTVNNATITITQGGVTKGSFTLNQATGDTIDLDAGGSGGSSYHPDLFDVKWADHICNDVQWLRADTFSWQSGSVYQVAYQHLADDIDGKTLQSETIGSTTIQFYLADDGHKICPASEESNVAAIYAATGVAWYYIIDTTNQRFKLPRRHSQKIVRSVKNADGSWYRLYADGWVEQGGIYDSAFTGTKKFTFPIEMADTQYALTTGTGCSNVSGMHGKDYITAKTTTGFSFTSVSLAGSFTVSLFNWQVSGQSAIDMSLFQNGEKYLYFYVGNFTQTALENTAGITTEEMNNKVDKGHQVIAFQAPTAENNYTWYRKYADGWVEQGGVVIVNSASVGAGTYSTTNITFPITLQETRAWKCQARHDRFNAGFENSTVTTGAKVYQVNDSTTSFANPFVIWEVKGIAAN